MLLHWEAEFVLGFVVYTGADADYQKFDLDVTGDIVVYFLQPYFYKGHVVWKGNGYTSPILSEFLHDRDRSMCSTKN